MTISFSRSVLNKCKEKIWKWKCLLSLDYYVHVNKQVLNLTLTLTPDTFQWNVDFIKYMRSREKDTGQIRSVVPNNGFLFLGGQHMTRS